MGPLLLQKRLSTRSMPQPPDIAGVLVSRNEMPQPSLACEVPNILMAKAAQRRIQFKCTWAYLPVTWFTCCLQVIGLEDRIGCRSIVGH